MTTSPTTRRLFLAAMFASIAGVLAWAGWIGWREWPRWRAVREMRAAVEANEPGRFLDAVGRVDSLGVAEAAADEIAPLRRHPDPRVRMYAVMARTVLGPRGPDEAKELIDLFDDPDEDIIVRRAAAPCLVLFGEKARVASASLWEAASQYDSRYPLGLIACLQLGKDVVGDCPWGSLTSSYRVPPSSTAPFRSSAGFLLVEADPRFGALY